MPRHYVGADLVGYDDIVGAAINEVMGAEIPDDQLAALMSGDDEIDGDLDDIIGAEVKKVKKSLMRKVAMAKAAGQRVNVSRDPSSMKWELLPIPAGTLAAGTTITVTVTPIRSQRLDQIEFPSSNPDHQFITLLGVQILGVEQLNGAGGIRLSQLSELRANNILRGSTAQRADNIFLTLRNDDAVNARSYYGSIGGPTIRVAG